jgi:hypothetical protein
MNRWGVIETDEGWFVAVGPFTNADAWRLLDRWQGDPGSRPSIIPLEIWNRTGRKPGKQEKDDE